MRFQNRVLKWCLNCFGMGATNDVANRTFRFLEEALELAQSTNTSKDDVLRLVDYVYSRPIGAARQEVGGVMITLHALCNALSIDCEYAAEDELERVWKKIDTIRKKDANKPKNSPLPQ